MQADFNLFALKFFMLLISSTYAQERPLRLWPRFLAPEETSSRARSAPDDSRKNDAIRGTSVQDGGGSYGRYVEWSSRYLVGRSAPLDQGI